MVILAKQEKTNDDIEFPSTFNMNTVITSAVRQLLAIIYYVSLCECKSTPL